MFSPQEVLKDQMPSVMGYILIVLLVILGGIGFLIKALRRRRSMPEELPYQKVDSLLTKAERSFYKVLRRVVGDEMHIFAKVRLGDLVWLPEGAENRQAYLNRVNQKHVDFVLCHVQTVAPVLVVELDDSSHKRNHRQESDIFKNGLFRTVGLPLLRVPVRRSYVPSELSELIRKEISRGSTESPG